MDGVALIDSVFGSPIYVPFGVLYLIVGIAAGTQVARIVMAAGTRAAYLSFWEHLLVFIVAVARCIQCFVYYAAGSGSLEISLGLLIVATALPYAALFWVYTLLLTAWSAIYHAATSSVGNDPFDSFKPYFIGISLLVSVLLLGSFAAFLIDESSAESISMAGSVMSALFSLVLSVGFVTYGHLLCAKLTQDFPCKHALKLFRIACVASVCFAVESGITLLSAFSPDLFFDNFIVLNSVYFLSETVNLSTVIFLFWHSVNVLVQKFKEHESHSRHGKGSHASRRGAAKTSSFAGRTGARASAFGSSTSRQKKQTMKTSVFQDGVVSKSQTSEIKLVVVGSKNQADDDDQPTWRPMSGRISAVSTGEKPASSFPEPTPRMSTPENQEPEDDSADEESVPLARTHSGAMTPRAITPRAPPPRGPAPPVENTSVPKLPDIHQTRRKSLITFSRKMAW